MTPPPHPHLAQLGEQTKDTGCLHPSWIFLLAHNWPPSPAPPASLTQRPLPSALLHNYCVACDAEAKPKGFISWSFYFPRCSSCIYESSFRRDCMKNARHLDLELEHTFTGPVCTRLSCLPAWLLPHHLWWNSFSWRRSGLRRVEPDLRSRGRGYRLARARVPGFMERFRWRLPFSSASSRGCRWAPRTRSRGGAARTSRPSLQKNTSTTAGVSHVSSLQTHPTVDT